MGNTNTEMADFARALNIYRRNPQRADKLLAELDLMLARENVHSMDAIALLAVLAEEHAQHPLPREVFVAAKKQIETVAKDKAEGNSPLAFFDDNQYADSEVTMVDIELGIGNAESSSITESLETVDAGLSSQGVDPNAIIKGVGDTLNNRFKLIESLGHGGMSKVYKAIDLRKKVIGNPDSYVAVKILNRKILAHKGCFEALEQEAKNSRELVHPNIIRTYDLGRDGSTVYMSMEYLSGESLAHKINIDSFHGMPREEALRIINNMGNALAFAHERGIVHYDFKPANILLTDRSEIKVIDFGIARACQPKDQAESQPQFLRALTPAYASSEMLEHLDPDPRDDIYALACIAYQLFDGRHPFNRVRATAARDAGMLVERPEGLNPVQWQALQKALAFDRNGRTSTVTEFLKGINALDKRWWPAAGVAASIAAAVAIGLGYYVLEFNKSTLVDSLTLDSSVKISQAPSGTDQPISNPLSSSAVSVPDRRNTVSSVGNGETPQAVPSVTPPVLSPLASTSEKSDIDKRADGNGAPLEVAGFNSGADEAGEYSVEENTDLALGAESGESLQGEIAVNAESEQPEQVEDSGSELEAAEITQTRQTRMEDAPTKGDESDVQQDDVGSGSENDNPAEFIEGKLAASKAISVEQTLGTDNVGTPVESATQMMDSSNQSAIQNVAPAENTGPENSQSTEKNVADQETQEENQGLDKLLVLASNHITAHRLTQPEGNNALETYREILQQAPNNAQALGGIEKIKGKYKQWGEAASQRSDWSKAQTHFKKALTIDPKDGAMVAALHRVKAAIAVQENERNKAAAEAKLKIREQKEQEQASAEINSAQTPEAVSEVSKEIDKVVTQIGNVTHKIAKNGQTKTASISANVTGSVTKMEVFVATSQRFLRHTMYDDGTHGDFTVGDGNYQVDIKLNEARQDIRYYVAAYTPEDTVLYSPARAALETYIIKPKAILGHITLPIVINEFMASNDQTIADPQGRYNDWIELYNTTAETIDLSGYYLSDDSKRLKKWRFPDGVTIGGYSYLLIWTDKRSSYTDISVDPPILHTNFDLLRAGEEILLVDTDEKGNAIIDKISFGRQREDVSTGRSPSGLGKFGTLNFPTPGAIN